MTLIPALALVADTLLVRPVAVPAPWYSVATGVLSIVVTVLLLGIAVALLGMARALHKAEDRLGARLQGLSTELVPLARNLNQIASQLSAVTTDAKADFARLSSTVGAVDDAVRSVIEATESRLARVATLIDAVQGEAEATVADATGLVRGVREGARSLLNTSARDSSSRAPRSRRKRRSQRDTWDAARTEAEVHARLAELEATLFESLDDDRGDDTAMDRDGNTDVAETDARHSGGPRVRRARS
jgi:uncharacterized protein YoxC